MTKLLHSLGWLLMLSATPVFAEPLADSAYVPLVFAYFNGAFVSVTQVAMPVTDLKECSTSMEKVVLMLRNTINMPHGSSFLGGCLPVPEAPTVTMEIAK